MAQNQSSPIPAQACNGIPAIAPPGAQTCRTRQWSPHCSHPAKQTPWPPSLHIWEGSPDSSELRHHHPSPPPHPTPQHCSPRSCGACAQESLVWPPGSSVLFPAAQPLCTERHPGSGGRGCRESQGVVSAEMRPGGHSPASPALLQSCVPRTNSLSSEGNAKHDKVSTK